MDKVLEEAKQKTETAVHVVDLVKQGTTDLSLHTVAKIQERLDAYKQVCKNYEGFIVAQAKEL